MRMLRSTAVHNEIYFFDCQLYSIMTPGLFNSTDERYKLKLQLLRGEGGVATIVSVEMPFCALLSNALD